MQQSTDLQNLLHSVHKKSYPAYKALKGSYPFNNYILSIDHVQGDPFASPSHISIRIPHKTAGFPKEYYKDSVTSMTLSDYLARQFEKQIVHYTFRAKGSGKSGLISISHCGQEVLKRTACEITEKEIIARFFIGFPANGRTINATELEKILFDFLPVCVQKAFLYKNTNHQELQAAIFLAEDQTCIRKQLSSGNLVAFVADGSILPRESGISSRPMKDSVPFISPESLRVTMTLPHKGEISGMGIPRGITLIVGGGYHGKSTLLKSLNRMNDLVEGCRIEGEVLLDGENIYKDMDVNLLRKRVGMVFQKPNPFPMSIYDNIAYGPRTHGIRSKVKLDELVENSLRGAAIWDEVKDRLKKSALGLSGGQQQRICIARALAVQPEVLLMDEPTSALDPISAAKVEELALELKKDYTIVMVTHNMQQAARISDRTAFFLLGEIVEFGKTEQIFSMPKDKRTEDYITGRFG